MSLITSIEVNEKSIKKELPNFEYYDKIWSPKERELTNVGFYNDSKIMVRLTKLELIQNLKMRLEELSPALV